MQRFAVVISIALASAGCSKSDCLCTFTGHSDYVCSVALSPSGKQIVSGGADGKIKFWDVETGECLTTLEGDREWVHSVAFTPDGRYLASGGEPLVKLWDLESGKTRHVLAGHTGIVNAVAFSPDGRLVASCGRGESLLALDANGGVSAKTQGFSIAVWDTASGKQLNTFDPGDFFQPSKVQFTPDGKRLLFAGDSLQLLDLQTGECLHVFEGHSDSVGTIAMSASGKWFASAGSFADRTIRLWDAESGDCLWEKEFTEQQGGAWSLAFVSEGRALVSGHQGGTLRYWDVESGKHLRTIKAHSGPVSSLSADAKGHTLASGGWDKCVKLWKVPSGEPEGR
jgi:WD40 repeat protein